MAESWDSVLGLLSAEEAARLTSVVALFSRMTGTILCYPQMPSHGLWPQDVGAPRRVDLVEFLSVKKVGVAVQALLITRIQDTDLAWYFGILAQSAMCHVAQNFILTAFT